jgi:hypothetical protein
VYQTLSYYCVSPSSVGLCLCLFCFWVIYYVSLCLLPIYTDAVYAHALTLSLYAYIYIIACKYIYALYLHVSVAVSVAVSVSVYTHIHFNIDNTYRIHVYIHTYIRIYMCNMFIVVDGEQDDGARAQ